MASIGGYVDIGFIPSGEAFVESIAMDGDEYVRCNRCGYGGCDIRVANCGCTAHAVRRNCMAMNGYRSPPFTMGSVLSVLSVSRHLDFFICQITLWRRSITSLCYSCYSLLIEGSGFIDRASNSD